MELKELYQEIILDHAKNPRNKGKCENYNRDAKAHNPLCGDKVHIYLNLDNNKYIKGLSFEGEGCAISLASASILTDIFIFSVTLLGFSPQDRNIKNDIKNRTLKALWNCIKINVLVIVCFNLKTIKQTICLRLILK